MLLVQAKMGRPLDTWGWWLDHAALVRLPAGAQAPAQAGSQRVCTHLLGKRDVLKVGADDVFHFPQGIDCSLQLWIQVDWAVNPEGPI